LPQVAASQILKQLCLPISVLHLCVRDWIVRRKRIGKSAQLGAEYRHVMVGRLTTPFGAVVDCQDVIAAGGLVHCEVVPSVLLLRVVPTGAYYCESLTIEREAGLIGARECVSLARLSAVRLHPLLQL
jgi:hypothetical protein